ncbi:MAG: CRTAC1 family protein [Acidobacteriaceae bacterium]|nr:CRTAC1 family protein [Acidobacteriaceae bacterium]
MLLLALLMCSIGPVRRTDSVSAAQEFFTDVTAQAGIHWRHFSGESQEKYLIEAMGGGVAFFDFDRDGREDLLFLTGGETPKSKGPAPPLNALYRNTGDGKFEDVTAKSGIARLPFYGMGVAAGDFDNDGYPDLFITGYPSSALLHNNRDGTFTDISEKAGVKNVGKWGASAAWFDYDRDGRLDLFVANYAKFSYEDGPHCDYQGMRTYCAQVAYEGERPTLYHNNGDGTFTDVTEQAGLGKLIGRALGVVAIDADDDGWPDLFVARDASPNLLLVNQHDGTFKDVALDAEVALSADGTARAGMGVDAGDVNGDGRPDFVVTDFNDETHALFLNSGKSPYREWTRESGLAALTRSFVGWGIHFIDFDNDGNLDLVLVNGHINQVIEKTRVDVSYNEPPLLLANNGKGVFRNVREQAGAVFRNRYLGRGLAVGDYDNDGGVDVVFTRLNEAPILLHNNVGHLKTWIGIELQGTKSNRDAIGAKLTLRCGARKLVRWITGGASYLSSHDQRVIFGLGEAPTSPVRLEIRWPNGNTQAVTRLKLNQYQTIVEQASGPELLRNTTTSRLAPWYIIDAN